MSAEQPLITGKHALIEQLIRLLASEDRWDCRSPIAMELAVVTTDGQRVKIRLVYHAEEGNSLVVEMKIGNDALQHVHSYENSQTQHPALWKGFRRVVDYHGQKLICIAETLSKINLTTEEAKTPA